MERNFYDLSVNGDLKKILKAKNIRYSQIAFVLHIPEKAVKNLLRVQLSVEAESIIWGAVETIIQHREELDGQMPNQEFRDQLKRNGISVYRLASAVERHDQTIRSWLSVPLSQERQDLLQSGVDRILRSRTGR